MRIVSLLPSATEIVFALGLGDELVGVTHECDWPPEATDIPIVTRSINDLAALSSREIDRLVGEAVHGLLPADYAEGVVHQHQHDQHCAAETDGPVALHPPPRP